MSFKRTLLALAAASIATTALASSHREAPFITNTPKVDGTDFYMFRSYESGRGAFTTLIANYLPLQDSYGGPNYFTLDPDALYEIHIDNNGDAKEDLTFQFRFTTTINGAAVPVSDGNGGTVMTPIPLVNAGNYAMASNRNVDETYSVKLVKGDRRTGAVSDITNATGGKVFTKPGDNVGNKSFPNGYAAYADQFITAITIPGCGTGKVFVGQRTEGFFVNLGQIFDLVNRSSSALVGGPRDGGSAVQNVTNNIISDKNVTSLALEIPTACLTNGTEPVIGGWTTASVRQSRVANAVPKGALTNKSATKGPQVAGGPWTQVSRLGSPLVNEVVIGLPDKDAFNSSMPKDDVGNFGQYVLFPSLPVLVNALFSVPPPPTPRIDLLNAFVTGIRTSVNGTMTDFTHPAAVGLASPFAGAGEMLRMNTAFPGTVTAAANQDDLGFLACDLSGFPNGRRPIDDVVDIALTVAEGALTGTNGLQTCDVSGPTPTVVRSGAIVTDGTKGVASSYLTVFPYLNTPIAGATAAGASP